MISVAGNVAEMAPLSRFRAAAPYLHDTEGIYLPTSRTMVTGWGPSVAAVQRLILWVKGALTFAFLLPPSIVGWGYAMGSRAH